MKIAIVCDFLKEYGGAERVLEILHEMYPEAPIYTAFVDWKGLGPHADRIKKWNVNTTWAQKIPLITKIYSPLRFLAPYFFESLDLSSYDVVISSTNAYYAKGIITQPHTKHLCYCHTPPRSLYGYATRMDWQKHVLTRTYGHIVNHFLRKYDFCASQRVDVFIANSREVKRRINKFYRRDSVVVYPAVDLAGFAQTVNKKTAVYSKYYLYVGKLALAKRVDLAIKACMELGLNLKIVGKGQEEKSLRQGTNSLIEFFGEVDDKTLLGFYQNCKAVIYPAVDEDFGIVPVEAMSFGKPVIAMYSGGVKESVIDGKTGVFYLQPTVNDLVNAIKKLQKLKINQNDCKKQAEQFKKDNFVKQIKKLVNNCASSDQGQKLDSTKLIF